MILQLAQSLIAPVTGILDKFIEDKDQKAAMAHEIATIADKQANEQAKAQIQLNAVEAAHTSMFVAGWRPFVGWVCAAALAYVAVLEPIIRFAAKVWGGYNGEFPVIDTNLTMQVLMGLLGLGAMRSVEKVKGGEASR